MSLLFAVAISAEALRCRMAIADIMPTNAPIASSQALVVMLLGSRQLRQSPPPEGWAELFMT